MNRTLLSAALDASIPTRLFRAASPSDVVCAAIIAGYLPRGNDLLALARDKSQADPDAYRECLESLVPLHAWCGVVDISGWSLTDNPVATPTMSDRWRQLWKVRESMAELRGWMAPLLGISPLHDALEEVVDQGVDEIYLNCLNHFDVRALYRIFPSARKIYYPHTLDSLAPSEADHYAPYCTRPRFRAEHIVRDQLKQVILGPDSVPVRHARFDRVYSFRRVPGWTNDDERLDVALTPATMSLLFDRLPSCVRSYFEVLSGRCGEGVGVLLLNPDDHGEEHPYDREVEGYLHLANELKRRGVRTILVKPHSRSSVRWNERVKTAFRASLRGHEPIYVDRYYHYPIEIILAPLRAVACAGMGTTCLGSLGRIYGMAAYCAEERMLQINAWNVAWRDNFRVWVDDYGKDYVSV